MMSCIFYVLVFNDGSSRDLMSLTGTVPVSYRGKKDLVFLSSLDNDRKKYKRSCELSHIISR